MKVLLLHTWLLFHCKNCSCVSENYVYCISKIEKRLEYLLIKNCWSQLTKIYNRLSEQFLPDSCTSDLEGVHTAPTSESRFRITGKDSEEQEKMYTFLSEQEKRIKIVLLLHLKWLLFFSFVNTVLVWNFLSQEIIKCGFFRQCVCTCVRSSTRSCTHCATESVDSMHAHMHKEHSSLVWGEGFWHELGMGTSLKGRCFLRPERYFVRTNIYLKGTSLHWKAALYKVFLE